MLLCPARLFRSLLQRSPRSSSLKARNRRARTASALALAFAGLLPHLAAQQNNLTTNLLTNPGAETGTLAGWTAGGPGGPPQVDTGMLDPGINPHTGTYDFVGYTGASDSLSQTVSLLTQGITPAMLDSGMLYANLSFWEQGLNQGALSDNGSVTLTFLDANGGTISTVDSGIVDSHNLTWANKTGNYAIPAGTRSITYTMNFLREYGSYLDAYIDDNNLHLSTTDGLVLSAKTLSFGNINVASSSAAQSVDISNPNATTVNIQQISLDAGANPSDFSQTNNCPAALVQNAACQINIVFTPHAVGAKNAGVQILTDSTPSDQGISLDGTGLGGILQVNPGDLKLIAGNGTAGYTGDGALATAAELNNPGGIAFDPQGNLYIADTPNHVIRKVDATGKITTFAGNGLRGFQGDGGPASAAELSLPFSVTSDAVGNIYIQDTGNYVIRKVDSDGIITTFAGTPGVPGHAGDGGPATAARFNQNQGARFDKAGNMYVPQCLGSSIRKIDTQGVITTVAGNFTQGFSGDGGPAIAAQLQCPSGVAIDDAGNLYIADDFNHRIRKVDTSGIITTIAGDGNPGFTGDGGAASTSEINLPNDVALDSAGNLYIADSANNRVRRIDTSGIITTAAGGLSNAGSAAVNTPLAVTFDSTSNLFFVDSGNSEIQELFPAGTAPFPATPIGTAATPKTLTLSNIGNVPLSIPSAASFTAAGANPADFSLTGGTCLANITLPPATGTCTLTVGFTPSAAGTRSLTVSIVDDALNSPQTFNVGGSGTPIAPTLTWVPPAAIPYGAPLTTTQLNATATGLAGAAIAGTFVYTPALGTVLGVGEHTLNVTFTSSDASYTSATTTVPISVIRDTPTISWNPPASISSGTPLSATQLDATATDGGGNPVSGIFTYTPPAGTVLSVGTHTLSVSFATNDLDTFITPAGLTVPITVVQPASTTTLAITVGSAPVTGVATGTVVTLIATVALNSLPVGPGQVTFCDSSTAACTDIHMLGTTQLTPAGTATYRFVPGIGNHFYTAYFQGTLTAASSQSGAVPFAVTGLYPSVTTIAQTAAAGNYTLTATVIGTAMAETPRVTGTVSFLDTGNANASLASAALGASSQDFSLRQPAGSPQAAGRGAYGVATGDFNGDGFQDTVTGNYSAGTVSVLLGNGDGTFKPQATYAVGTEPERVLVADLNGDGKLDLIVANTGSGTIGVLLGNGDGTFQPQVAYQCASPVGLGVMDVNHDGIPDIVAGDYYANTISVLLGNADGTLQAAVTYATGRTPQTVAEGDFNGDGNVDVAVGNEGSATVGIFLGNGDGTFQAMITYPVGNLPQGVQVGDFNRDGKQDLALTNQGDGTISVLLGNGDGTFQGQTTYPVGVQPVGLAIADFNGDGFADITVGNTGQASLTQGVLLGNGDGTFQPQMTFPTGNFPYGVATADFNGDGLPDMAVANFNDATATILLSQVTQTAMASASLTSLSPGTHLVAASYPGDGYFGPSLSPTTTLVGAAATPIISWTPAVSTFPYGTPLGAAQLNATAATAAGIAIPGTFTYAPAAGTVLTPGTQTLSAAFTPADAVAFTAATATVQITVTGPSLLSLTPVAAKQGDAATTITLTGSGFMPASVVLLNAAPLSTAYVNPTTLTAVIPASTITTTGTVQIAVSDPSINTISAAQPFAIVPATTDATLSGPSTTPPGSQPVVTLAITQPYPFDLTATFALSFAGASTPPVDDPAIQFAEGGRTLSVIVPANATTVPPVQLQSGTDAGTITVPVVLTADGLNVTPAALAPLTIVVPAAAPVVTSATLTRSGKQLTVAIHGFSNTREVSQASFHFTATSGTIISTPDLTVPATTLFGDWFGSAPSVPFGSTFTYTQIFDVSDDAANVASVDVKLTNSVGASTVITTIPATAP